MGLETATYISDLVSTNPPSSDLTSQGDDHLRLLKAVLKAQFPGATRPFPIPTTLAKTGSYSVLSTDQNTTILVDTTAGVVTLTLPTLTSTDAGWNCDVMKTNTGTSPVLIAPPSGTLQSGAISGLAATRRCIPGVKSNCFWTGSLWIIARAVLVPVGTCLEYHGTSLPVGYEWPSGQTLASASTNYPDFYSINGSSGVTDDRRGRVAAAKDNLGGSAASRLTAGSMTPDAATKGATGGTETRTISQANLPNVTLVTTATVPDHAHTVKGPSSQSPTGSGLTYASNSGWGSGGAFGSTDATSLTITASTALGGSGTALVVVQPTILENFILVVE